jgi:sugar phosphate isomerase/epimerase
MARQPLEGDELGPEHLVLSHFSLGATDFDTRCAATGSAGFDAIGVLHREYSRMVHDQGRTPQDLIDVAAAHGLRVVEIEAVRSWSTVGWDPSRVDLCLEMAAAFDARHITAVGAFDGTIEEAALGFAQLCDRAADIGAKVGLEPIPVQEAHDIATGREIVERAGRDNGGLCVDSWHLIRGGAHWDQLETLPGEMVTSIQIDDGPIEPEHHDYIEDCLWNRRLCGDGEFDLARFVQTLDRIGATAPYSVEIISTDLWAQDPFDVAQRMATTTRETIATARALGS